LPAQPSGGEIVRRARRSRDGAALGALIAIAREGGTQSPHGATLDIDRSLRLHADQTTELATLVFDRDGAIVWCNDAAARTFACAREALVGKHAREIFTPEDVRDGVADFELAVSRESTDMDNDRWMLRADGARFWAAGATTAVRDNGELIGFVKVLRDRTDVKEQLELQRNRIEALLAADQHKNIFLSTLSHELRNPLAPLTNALQLMRMTNPENASLQYPIKLIERQVEFIRRLIDDLLDVTRISAGKVQLKLEPIDVREIIARAVETTRPFFAQRKHELAVHLLQTPIVVRADAARLEQVFVNLLTNAAKYTPEGGEVEVRASVDESEAIVHVTDNGVGIPLEMQPHIFELFTQVSGHFDRADGGLGIGLSLVKNFVELHGGSVQVRSAGQGSGSTFTVRLPLAQPR
jgi:PAS domain S-box-containing protein